jgi:ribosomal protein S18 acetylase RimI-like enzyme
MTAAEIRTRTASNVSLHVGAPGPAVAAEAAALLNESLGSGFIRPSALAELTINGRGVLIRARSRDGDLLGASTACVLDHESHTALQDRLRLATGDAGLDGHRVGEIKSIAVAPAARGMGLGTIMLAACLDYLKAGGCRYVVSASWVSADPQHSSLGMFERAGFAQLATIPGYWADDQKVAGYLCPMCGPECVCAAIILALPLEDGPARALPGQGPWSGPGPSVRGAGRV